MARARLIVECPESFDLAGPSPPVVDVDLVEVELRREGELISQTLEPVHAERLGVAHFPAYERTGPLLRVYVKPHEEDANGGDHDATRD